MITFLEGLPGVGKTTLSIQLKSPGVAHVPEILIANSQPTGLPQNNRDKFYMKNDSAKVEAALKSEAKLTIVDRGPISTLAYSLVQHKLSPKYDPIDVLSWFSNIKEVYSNPKTKVIFLDRESIVLPCVDINNPYGSRANQLLLKSVVINLVKQFCNYQIVEYDYQSDFERMSHEISNQSMLV